MVSSQNRQRRKFCPTSTLCCWLFPSCHAIMTVTVHVLTGSEAAATTESKCHWHSPNDATAFFFLKTDFFFFFCRMWIAGNERGPTQSRFSCSDSHFCTKPLLAAHYTGTVQPNQRAGLGLHCCHGERIICIRKKKKKKKRKKEISALWPWLRAHPSRWLRAVVSARNL